MTETSVGLEMLFDETQVYVAMRSLLWSAGRVSLDSFTSPATEVRSLVGK